MNDEQTKKTDTGGIQNDSPIEEARKVLEEINIAKEEFKAENDRSEKIKANELLSGTSGGHIETKVSEEELKKQQAKQYWKGTAIEEAVNKYNE